MDIKTREEALSAPSTSKYKLKAFERRIADLRIYELDDFVRFLYSEKCEGVYDLGKGVSEMMKEYYQTGRFPLSDIQYIGDSLESNFQFRKDARSREMVVGEKTDIYPQRFHCRVYLKDDTIVIVSETEIDPKDVKTGVAHLLEGQGELKRHPKPEHRIIRIQYRKKSWIQRLFTKR